MTASPLRDWCQYSRTGTAYIEHGSPWQNPFVESFHSRVRDELLDVEAFACGRGARRDRGLAPGLQPAQAAQLVGDARPRRGRCRVGRRRDTAGRITRGPVSMIRSVDVLKKATTNRAPLLQRTKTLDFRCVCWACAR